MDASRLPDPNRYYCKQLAAARNPLTGELEIINRPLGCGACFEYLALGLEDDGESTTPQDLSIIVPVVICTTMGCRVNGPLP